LDEVWWAQWGWTPLLLAADDGYAEVVDVLLAASADVNADTVRCAREHVRFGDAHRHERARGMRKNSCSGFQALRYVPGILSGIPGVCEYIYIYIYISLCPSGVRPESVRVRSCPAYVRS
jgi:hypothetical protein